MILNAQTHSHITHNTGIPDGHKTYTRTHTNITIDQQKPTQYHEYTAWLDVVETSTRRGESSEIEKHGKNCNRYTNTHRKPKLHATSNAITNSAYQTSNSRLSQRSANWNREVSTSNEFTDFGNKRKIAIGQNYQRPISKRQTNYTQSKFRPPQTSQQ